jgi:Ca2+-binding EF-hand superfamily protein
MKVCFFLLTVTALLFALCVATADTPKATPENEATHDVVFFGETRPVLLRLHVTVDGKALDAVWNEFIDTLFKSLDTNGDGVLSKTEAERVPPPQMLFTVGVGLLNTGGPPLGLRGLDANADGKVTRDELAAYYKAHGGAPLQLQMGPGQSSPYVVINDRTPGTPRSTQAVNDALFALLDTNKDGKLSKEELRVAAASVLKADENDDEVVTAAELTPDPNPTPIRGVSRAAMPAPMGQFLLMGPGMQRALIAGMKSKYGRGGDLTRAALGLDEATFALLDANKDGKLDDQELARFTDRLADVEAAVGVGAGAKEAVELTRTSPVLAGSAKAEKNAVALELGLTRLSLQRGDTDRNGMQIRLNIKDIYSGQFNTADKDNNGYIDEQEAKDSNFIRGVFKYLDRDGDGKLYLKEMLAALDEIQDLQNKAMKSCACVVVTDQGKGLFEMLDTNKDGKLSVRELRQAAKSLAELSRSNDGGITRADIPREHVLSVNRGPANNNQADGRVVVVSKMYGGPTPANRAAPPNGPAWFHKMDRNRDGDVSRREFLGSDEEFRKIDADGDGLISLDEAIAFDAKFRAPIVAGAIGRREERRPATDDKKEKPAEEKKPGFVGMKLTFDDDAKTVEVAEVIPDSPAAKAGLKSGDILLKVGDTEAKDAESVVKAVRATKPGDKLTLKIKRDGKEQEIKVTVGEPPKED